MIVLFNSTKLVMADIERENITGTFTYSNSNNWSYIVGEDAYKSQQEARNLTNTVNLNANDIVTINITRLGSLIIHGIGTDGKITEQLYISASNASLGNYEWKPNKTSTVSFYISTAENWASVTVAAQYSISRVVTE